MRMTLARAESFVRRAAHDWGMRSLGRPLEVEVVSSRWMGERSRYRDGSPGWFRYAGVTVREVGKEGTAEKWVTLESDGSVRVH